MNKKDNDGLVMIKNINDKKKLKNPVIWIIITIAVVIADQITKYLALVHLKPLGSAPFIKNILDFNYITNRGAAFGMLSDYRWIYISVSIIAILVMLYILLFFKERTKLLDVAVALMLGGGIGNMIDRLRLGYVIDFLEFSFVNFAIFNIADSCVCVGAAFMCIYMIRHEIFKPKVLEEVKLISARTDDHE